VNAVSTEAKDRSGGKGMGRCLRGGGWCFRGGLGKKEILRRVAPLDDGQKRFGWKADEARRSGAFVYF
jgi:hypothetical protein